MQYCPCGTHRAYLDCCGIFISHQKLPATPEELMRSRYTAYNLGHIDYIADTMRSPAADDFDIEASREWARKIKWTGLKVVKATQNAATGFVEFFAYYYHDNKKCVLHEYSEFNCENGKWYYVNGTQPNKQMHSDLLEKIGRNDVCPCGSKKKYKKCCGNPS
jgi:SEC-C motif-containing protein